jgi:DNA polymerase I-like protein with 3'-5' exonuclease and polymerase domains
LEHEKRRDLLFDIETNGLLPTVSQIHCVCIIDTTTEEVFSFGPDNIDAALDMLYEAETLLGHNVLSYDLKVLAKLKNWHTRPGTRVLDTLVASRLIHPDLKKQDAPIASKLPGKLYGSHSLKAWGIRLGVHKIEYDGGWEVFTPEMLSYCEGDLRTNLRLLRHLKPMEYPQAPLELEHRVEEIVGRMTEAGWYFDSKSAQALYTMLVEKRDVLEASLVDKFGSWQEIDKQFVAKRDNKVRGFKKGDTVTNWKTVVFNPGSRVHIEKKLREAGWEPEEFTDKGRAKLDGDTMENIKLPEAQDLIDYLLIQKRLGQLSDGDNGWLRLVDENGLLHSRYNPMGTVTSRAAHSKPNIGQVPNSSALYGPECRALFGVPLGWKLVGADMAGAQLRILGHWMSYIDKGAYGRIVVDGDVHTFHKDAAAPDIKTRDDSKTTIYALIFGAFAPKIGKINGLGAAGGKRILNNLMSKIPALGKITKAVKEACKKGFLKTLDGRRVPIRSDHSALNFLIQSSEAVLCKTWLCNAYDALCAKYQWGYSGDFVIAGFIHDELQVACREEIADDVGEILVKYARNAGESYNFRVRLDSDYKVGNNWQETH